MVYIKPVMTLLALVAIVFTPNNIEIVSIFIVILHLQIEVMQIFDTAYVSLTPFSRSFEYIFSILDSDDASSSAY